MILPPAEADLIVDCRVIAGDSIIVDRPTI